MRPELYRFPVDRASNNESFDGSASSRENAHTYRCQVNAIGSYTPRLAE